MKLNAAIRNEMGFLAGGDDKARLAARIQQVQQRYRQVIEKVYRQNAQIFLDHTNSVYIMNKDGEKILIVYMDESIYAAELNAQRELIRLHMLQMFNEDIAVFDIHVSRGAYKKKYLYKGKDAPDSGDVELARDEVRQTLTTDQEAFIDQTVSGVADEKLRKVIEKAMTADLKRQKE